MQHAHEIDGRLRDDCPGCDLIRERRTRDKAHTEVDADLERIHEKAQLRYHPNRKKDQ